MSHLKAESAQDVLSARAPRLTAELCKPDGHHPAWQDSKSDGHPGKQRGSKEAMGEVGSHYSSTTLVDGDKAEEESTEVACL